MNTKKNPPTLTETIALRIPLDHCRALVAVCRQQDRSISWVVRNLIYTYLRNQPQMSTSSDTR